MIVSMVKVQLVELTVDDDWCDSSVWRGKVPAKMLTLRRSSQYLNEVKNSKLEAHISYIEICV